MKRSILLAAASMLALTGTAHALNPISGTYGGFFIGGSYAPDITLKTTNVITGKPMSSTLGFKGLVNAGGQIGYRFCDRYRVEAELLYNKNPYSFLNIGNYTVHSPSTSTGLRMQGGTTSGIAFANGYYDFLSDDDTSSVVPYAGLGIGYAYLYNAVEFYNNEVLVPNSHQKTSSTRPAGQAILGVSYFLDDFMSFGIDFRYYGTITTKTTTSRTNQMLSPSLSVGSINFLFNGVLDFG